MLEAAGATVHLAHPLSVKACSYWRVKNDLLTELLDVFAAQDGCVVGSIAGISGRSVSPGLPRNGRTIWAGWARGSSLATGTRIDVDTWADRHTVPCAHGPAALEPVIS